MAKKKTGLDLSTKIKVVKIDRKTGAEVTSKIMKYSEWLEFRKSKRYFEKMKKFNYKPLQI